MASKDIRRDEVNTQKEAEADQEGRGITREDKLSRTDNNAPSNYSQTTLSRNIGRTLLFLSFFLTLFLSEHL